MARDSNQQTPHQEGVVRYQESRAETTPRPGSTRTKRRWPVLVMATLAITLTACSATVTTGTQPPDAAGGLPEGYERVEAAGAGAEIALPSGWTPVDDTTIDEAVREHGSSDPVEQQLGRQAQDLLAKGGMFATAPASAVSPAGYASNVAIVRIPVRATAIDGLVEEIRRSLAENPLVEGLTVRATSLPAGEAVHATYTLAMEQGSVDTVFYALPAGDGSAVTLTMGTDQPDRYRPVFDTIAGTLRVTGEPASPPATEPAARTDEPASPPATEPAAGTGGGDEPPDLKTAALQELRAFVGDDGNCAEYDWEADGELATLTCTGHGFDEVYYSIFADAGTMDAGFEQSVENLVLSDPANQTENPDCADGQPTTGTWENGRFACFQGNDGEARVVFTADVEPGFLVVDGYLVDGTIADVNRAWQELVAAPESTP